MAKWREKSFETAVFEQFARMDERFAKIDEHFSRIDQSLGRLNERMDRLEEDSRRLGVRFEALNDKFDTLLEGYNVLDAKIDRHYQEFCEFRSETNEKFEMLFRGLRSIRV